MREAAVISELRAALRRQGVWGARAERLIQDWTDHAREDAALRVEQGSAPEEARDAAWRALGVPEVLAASAARELAKGSWLGRHPWLGGMVLPGLGWMVATVVVVGVPALIGYLVTGGDFADPAKCQPALLCWKQAVNWVPWALSMAWLGRIAARMPGGWKLYWITAAVLTLCAPAAQMEIHPPVHGPQSGNVVVNFGCGMTGVISSSIQQALGHLPLVGPRFRAWVDDFQDAHPMEVRRAPQTIAWIQTAIMLLGVLTFYFKARTRSGVTGAVQPS